MRSMTKTLRSGYFGARTNSGFETVTLEESGAFKTRNRQRLSQIQRFFLLVAPFTPWTELIGRWKAFCLLIRAIPEQELSNAEEMIRVLQALNVRFSDRPIVLTSDLGVSLGPQITASLQGLPYKVRYSLDVCLAHGFL